MVAAWRLYSWQAEVFLERLLGFLRLKKEHAHTALEFRKLVAYGKNSLTDAGSAKRTALAFKIRELNAKTGKGKLPTSLGR